MDLHSYSPSMASLYTVKRKKKKEKSIVLWNEGVGWCCFYGL